MFRRGLFKEFSPLFSQLLWFSDFLLVLLGGIIAYMVRFGNLDLPYQYKLGIIMGGLLAMLIFPKFGLYESWRGKLLIDQVTKIFLAVGSVAISMLVLAYAIHVSTEFSRIWASLWFVASLFLILLLRATSTLVLGYLRKKGWNQRQVAIVGAGDLGREIASRIINTNWAGYELLAFWDDDPKLANTQLNGVPVYTAEDGFAKIQACGGVDELWIALPMQAEHRINEIIYLVRNTTIAIRFFPNLFGTRLFSHGISEVMGIPIVNLSVSPIVGFNRFLKSFEDLILSLFLLLLTSPIFVILAIMVKMTSPGPVFYRQERIGRNGKKFTILKFRTMSCDAEENGVIWGNAKDKPLTSIGAALRAYNLDELPQLLNVLKGDMSIVGPRPERPMFVEKFKHEIPGYMKKHMVNAGITGWAQIHGYCGDTDLHKRIEYDLYYIENWSLWLDIKIIFMTIVNCFQKQSL